MRKTSLLALITSLALSSSVQAQNPDTAYLALWEQARQTPLACESQYQSRFSRMEDNRFWRKFAKYSLIGVGAASGIVLWGGLHQAGVEGALVESPFSPTFFGGIGAFLGAQLYDVLDREEELRLAYHALKFSAVPFADLRTKPDQRYLTPIDFIAADVNDRRVRLKLKPMDYEDVRKELLERTKTTEDCRYTTQGKLKLTGIRQLTKAMKRKLDQ